MPKLKSKKAAKRDLEYPKPSVRSKYYEISRYFTRIEFLKLFSERVSLLLSRYYDEERAVQLFKFLTDKRVKIIGEEDFFRSKFFFPNDVGAYAYKAEPENFKAFVSKIIVFLKQKEGRTSYIDLSSIPFYMSYYKFKGLATDEILEMGVYNIAAEALTLSGQGFNTPYRLKIILRPIANSIFKKLKIRGVQFYGGILGIFIRAFIDLYKDSFKKTIDRPEISVVLPAKQDTRENQIQRLCMVFGMDKGKLSSFLKDIKDLGEDSLELRSALQKLKNETGYTTINSLAVIQQLRYLKEHKVLKTLPDLGLGIICEGHPLSSYIKINSNYYKGMDINYEIVEPESFVNAFTSTFETVEIDCTDMKEFEKIKPYLYDAADILMGAYRRSNASLLPPEKIKSVEMEIHLKNVENITLDFIREVKGEEKLLCSKYNRNFIITIAYPENALHVKGGRQLPQYFRVISDIHTDVNLMKNYIYDFGDDFILNCGDTAGDCATERDWIRTFIKTGVSVAGNHMGYNSATPKLDGKGNLKKVGSITHPYNTKNGQIYYIANHFPLNYCIRYLSNSLYEDENMVIIGSTLYTDFKLFGEKNKEQCMMLASKNMNDFKYCTTYVSAKEKGKRKKEDEIGDKGKIGGSSKTLTLGKVKRFTVEEHARLFETCVGYIRNRIEDMRRNNDDRAVIIVTHHAPTLYSIEDKYKNDPLSAAYASDLRWLIKEYPEIRLWCSGHTHHRGVDYIYEGCRFVSEPFGYYTENFNDITGGVISDYGKRIKIKDVIETKKSWEEILDKEIKEGTVKVYQD
mgnify:CR=1 FL=1